MKQTCLVLLLVGLAFSPVGADEDSPDAGKLQGKYTIASGEKDGKALPEGDFRGSVVVITRDKIVGTDKDKKEFFACTYTLDTTTRPWLIKMTSTSPKAGDRSVGVIEMDGEAVKLCYALPGGKPPATFRAGEKQHCFVLKRSAR